MSSCAISSSQFPSPSTQPPDPLGDNVEPLRPGVTNRTLRENGVTLDRSITGHSLKIPYFRPLGAGEKRTPVWDEGPFFRRRLLHPKPGQPKYIQRPGTSAHAYVPAGSTERIADRSFIIVTEGEFKALALAEAGLPAVAIGGIYNFRGGDTLVPELGELFEKFSTIKKLFFLGDADTALNPQFAGAATRFCALIRKASPDTEFFLPRMKLEDLCEQKGIDDAKAVLGEAQFGSYFQELLRTAIPINPDTPDDELAFQLIQREFEGLRRLVQKSNWETNAKLLTKVLRLANACGPVRASLIAEAAVDAALVTKGSEFKAELKRQASKDRRSQNSAVSKCPVELYYCPKGAKNYFLRSGPDSFTLLDRRGAVNHLLKAGYSRAQDGEALNEIDRKLTAAEEQPVDWVGPLAGRRAGWYQIQGRQILVTSSPRLIAPKPGDWKTIKDFIIGLLDGCTAQADGEPEAKAEDTIRQSQVFLAWLALALRDLYLHAGRFRPAQASIFCGPKRSGKNVLQDMITKCLGDRSETPFGFMEGRTAFNGNLIGAEHWMMADEQVSQRFTDREKSKASIKSFCVNRFQSINAKFSEAVNLDPFRRVTMSLNDDAESLKVLPSLSPNFADKLIIFRVFKTPFHGEGTRYPDFESWWKQVTTELPAFIQHLVHVHEIPPELTCPDYGVISYKNAAIVAAMEQESQEMYLAELIDRYFFNDGLSSWRGTASQVISILTNRASLELDPSYRNPQKVGRLLKALTDKSSERFRHAGVVHGYATYEIQAPTAVADSAP